MKFWKIVLIVVVLGAMAGGAPVRGGEESDSVNLLRALQFKKGQVTRVHSTLDMTALLENEFVTGEKGVYIHDLTVSELGKDGRPAEYIFQPWFFASAVDDEEMYEEELGDEDRVVLTSTGDGSWIHTGSAGEAEQQSANDSHWMALLQSPELAGFLYPDKEIRAGDAWSLSLDALEAYVKLIQPDEEEMALTLQRESWKSECKCTELMNGTATLAVSFTVAMEFQLFGETIPIDTECAGDLKVDTLNGGIRSADIQYAMGTTRSEIGFDKLTYAVKATCEPDPKPFARDPVKAAVPKTGIEVLWAEKGEDGAITVKLVDPAEGVRTLRGGDKVGAYKLVDADALGATFETESGERFTIPVR